MPVREVVLDNRMEVEPVIGQELIGDFSLLLELASPDCQSTECLLLALQRRHDLLAQDLLVEKVLNPDAEAQGLVSIGRPDTAAGGPDRQLSELQFICRVQQDVVRHDQMGVG